MTISQIPEPDRWEKKPARIFGGVLRHYTHSSRVQIPQHWQEFAPVIGTVPNQIGTDCFGVCLNAGEEGFDYMTAVEVRSTDNLPAGFTSVDLPAQRFAVFVHAGHVSAIVQTACAIWDKWLPASGMRAAPQPWFERYTEEFNPDTGSGGMEIWIPIQN